MGRSPRRCSQDGLNKGAWTALEDKTLIDYINTYGEGKWSNVYKRTGLKRCGKSCRLRWMNYLRPDIKRGNISEDEEELIIRLHKLLGNRWSLIAGRLPGRTDNEIKNYWNTNLAKKAQDQLQSSSSSPPPPPLPSFPRMENKPIIRMPGEALTGTVSNQTDTNNSNGDGPPSGDHYNCLAPIRPKPDSATDGGANYSPTTVPLGPTSTSSTLLLDHDDDAILLPNSNTTIINTAAAMESDSSDRSSSFTCGDDPSPNFMMDFNMDDIYQILDPEFAQLDGVVMADLNLMHNNEEAQEEEEEEEEGQKQWSKGCAAISDHVQADVGSDFRSLASFLESEDWLGDDDHISNSNNINNSIACEDHDQKLLPS